MKILAAEMIPRFPTWGWIVIGCTLAIILIVMVIWRIHLNTDFLNAFTGVMLVVGFLVILITGIIGSEYPTETGRYRYKVIFENEEPDLEELSRKYVIEKDEGLIWVLEEREVRE